MSEAVDFSKPICVQHFTAQITSATYDRHQTLHPERYEIFWQGKRWTVRGDNVVQGPTDAVGQIAPDYIVRNVDWPCSGRSIRLLGLSLIPKNWQQTDMVHGTGAEHLSGIALRLSRTRGR